MPILTARLITTRLRCLLPLRWPFSCGFYFKLFIIFQMLNFVLQHHCVCQGIPQGPDRIQPASPLVRIAIISLGPIEIGRAHV